MHAMLILYHSPTRIMFPWKRPCGRIHKTYDFIKVLRILYADVPYLADFGDLK